MFFKEKILMYKKPPPIFKTGTLPGLVFQLFEVKHKYNSINGSI